MNHVARDAFLVGPDDPILVTGATGFIGSRVVANLVERGFRNLRCFARPSSKTERLQPFTAPGRERPGITLLQGNLLSSEDCAAAAREAALIFHLAASTGDKSYPGAFLNSVVTTRNLLDASRQHAHLRRFVLVSSFAVYSNRRKRRWRLLDESCPLEDHPELRGDAYCYAKIKQEEIVAEYGKQFGIPYTIVRPGYVFGPGKKDISDRVGIGTFGVFLHLGGANPIPLTYVENCADAIVLAGLQKGVEGEAFNVVDDDLPSSRQFLRLYQRNVRQFASLYVPHAVSYGLCSLWERYSNWSEGQLPPVFNRSRWHAYWKKTRYANEKLKARLGWRPTVPMTEAFRRYFESFRENEEHA